MSSIDEIFEWLSWYNSEEIQRKGISEAKKIKNMSVLILPIESKSIWHNCAKVIAEKTDKELDRYLYSLFEWLQDMNWPGAEIIYNRLLKVRNPDLIMTYKSCLSDAIKTGDIVWEAVLNNFYSDYKLNLNTHY